MTDAITVQLTGKDAVLHWIKLIEPVWLCEAQGDKRSGGEIASRDDEGGDGSGGGQER